MGSISAGDEKAMTRRPHEFHRGIKREDLVCRIIELRYNFEAHACQLFLPNHNCTDMTGAINLAKAIDPDVIIVETFEGGKAETAYIKLNGEWESRLMP